MIKPTSKSTGIYLPTPAQIAAATAKIRDGWSDDEERKRNVYCHCAGEDKTFRVRGIEVPNVDD